MTLNCLNFALALIFSSHLLPHADVSLLDEDTGVVNRLGETKLEHLGLQPALHEVLGLEGEHVVELHLVLGEHAGPHEAPEQRVTLEQPLGILLVQGEQLAGGGPDLGQAVLHPPDLLIHILLLYG